MGIKIKAKCHQCGTKNVLDIEPAMTSGKIKINFVCQNCGALNELDIDPQNLGDTEQDWLCIAPEGFEWTLPIRKDHTNCRRSNICFCFRRAALSESLSGKIQVGPGDCLPIYAKKERHTDRQNDHE